MTNQDVATHSSISELMFITSLGTPVEGLHYQLNDGRGNAWAGTTGPGGAGVSIVEVAPVENSESSGLWVLPGGATIQIEVRRDDGSWKYIGSYLHAVGVHKEISVIAGTVAMPFEMNQVQ